MATSNRLGWTVKDAGDVTTENLNRALDAVRAGLAILWVCTYTRQTRIDAKCLARWATVPGNPLIRVDGTGFRLRNGKRSVHVFPGYNKLQTL